jgi:hypothetical protein
MNTINYGIGKEYLKDWGLNEALREIYQNFIDYGEFSELVENSKEEGKSVVRVFNEYEPEGLEFLRIGNSVKKEGSIGKHGEGLKMALLIFLREDLNMGIRFKDQVIMPKWQENSLIGEVLSLTVKKSKRPINGKFEIAFLIDTKLYEKFRENIIKEEDVIFHEPYHGKLVNKPKGSLYAGGLFICHIKSLKNAYDLNPARLPLDRDRRIPGSFETNYHTSKINEAHGQFEWNDQEYDDTKYMEKLPADKLKEVKVIASGNSYAYVANVKNKETGEKETIQITNASIKNSLNSSGLFTKTIRKITAFLTRTTGVEQLLLNFKENYCHNEEAKAAIDNIMFKLGFNVAVEEEKKDLPF